jgi:hypothetical protein
VLLAKGDVENIYAEKVDTICRPCRKKVEDAMKIHVQEISYIK